MLGNFMEDVGITPAQFEYASFKTRQHHHSLRFDQSTFEQIWAANNYEMFKRMMTRRNIDLQLQALELIERKYGKLPQSLILSQKETDVRVESQHKEICPKSGETEDIEKVILDEVAKKFIEEEPSDTPEIESLLEEKQVLESTRDEITSEMPTSGTELSIAHEISDGQLVPGGFNKVELLERTNKEALGFKSEEKGVTPLATKSIQKTNKEIQPSRLQQIDHLEMKRRQEYLRKQRDKLVALKKEERRKQFDRTDDEHAMKKTRPKSAKAAEAVLTGEQSVIPSQELQLRKALAERLKLEVVDKNRK
ncbi:cilia- and flagella-associated protein 36 isoform X2 [Coccinella septempunctata]|nr:cilia- and flagella-associated protein 36 isoform X2 [Coccinella septempunctata]